MRINRYDMGMKNIAKLLLSLLIPITVFAQNQGDDLGLGQGATSIVGRTNEARASLAGANGKANYIGLNAKGDVYTIPASVEGAGDFGASMPIAPLFVVADAAEALSTTTVIVATAHVARVNDYVEMTAGTAANVGVWRRVSAVATNSIAVATAFPATVAAADAFNIHRPRLDSSVYAEDTAHVSGNLGQMALAVRNTGMSNLADTTGDFSPIGTGGMGNPLVSLVWDNTLNATNTAVFIEDSALTTTANAGLKVFAQNQDPLTVDVSNSGDAGFSKLDLAGRTVVTMAPASERWSACSASNTGTSDTAIKALVASNKICVTSLSCFNTATVASSFEIKSNATAIYAGGISNSTLAGVAYWEHSFPTPICTAVGEALNFDMATTATATTCCGAGFITTN